MALEPGHGQSGSGIAFLCSQHLGQSLQEHFSQTHLDNLGFGVFGWFFGWLAVPPLALKYNFHVEDEWKGRMKGSFNKCGCITGRGTRSMPGEDQEIKAGLQQPCRDHSWCAVSSSSTQPLSSFPPPPGTGLPWEEAAEESTQPHQCQQGDLKEQEPIRVKLCSFWLAKREEEE